MKLIDLEKKYKSLENKEVQIKGWVRNNRDSSEVGFLMINDGSCFNTYQAVYNKELENFLEIGKITVGSSVEVTGEVIVLEGNKQKFEILAKSIKVIKLAPSEYPIQPKRHTMEFLREQAHLRSRTNTFSAVFRVRSLLAQAIHSFFGQEGFIYVHTPIITGSDAEGAGEMFRVTNFDLNKLPKGENGEIMDKKDFFGKKTNLSVSGQLQAEAFAQAFGSVYTFGPTFRAENSNTTKHASEFWMIEPEVAFAELNDIMDLSENMLKYVINYVFEHAPDDMDFFNNFVSKGKKEQLQDLVKSKFHSITYTEAIELLENSEVKFENKVYWGVDLSTEHERYLTDVLFKAPVFLTDYPKDIKAFYMTQSEDKKTVKAVDLLVPGIGELLGGSQREHDLDNLLERMNFYGIEREELEWYLELREYGGVVSSGFGIGFERLVMYITGMENIRDVIPFPRTPKNARF